MNKIVVCLVLGWVSGFLMGMVVGIEKEYQRELASR